MSYGVDRRCTFSLSIRPCAFALPLFSRTSVNPGALQNRSCSRIANSASHLGNIIDDVLPELDILDVSARGLRFIF